MGGAWNTGHAQNIAAASLCELAPAKYKISCLTRAKAFSDKVMEVAALSAEDLCVSLGAVLDSHSLQQLKGII